MTKKELLLSVLLMSGSSINAYAAAQVMNPWSGSYFGVSASVISTTVSNSAQNNYGFTTGAFGVSGAYNWGFSDNLILGLGIQLNGSPFRNTAFNDKGDRFYMQNQSKFFGSLMGNVGVAINRNFACLVNAGVGYLKTKTTGQTYGDNPRFSDHSDGFVLPTIGGHLMYRTDRRVYGKVGVDYYMPMSQTYYSTVGIGNATLRKSLFRAGIEIGWQGLV